MTRIKFTISSHKDYYENTYELITDSLIKAGILPSDIYFFIGGLESYEEITNDKGIKLYTAPHNSLDFTGLISVFELDIESEYWFLLHDTCYVGENFYKTILQHPHHTNTISLSFDLSMNIGAYKWSYLQEVKSSILKLKNNNDSDLQSYKQKLVACEDVLLTKEDHYTDIQRQNLGTDTFYGNSLRVAEYFPKIDLYKLKANWINKSIYTLTL